MRSLLLFLTFVFFTVDETFAAPLDEVAIEAATDQFSDNIDLTSTPADEPYGTFQLDNALGTGLIASGDGDCSPDGISPTDKGKGKACRPRQQQPRRKLPEQDPLKPSFFFVPKNSEHNERPPNARPANTRGDSMYCDEDEFGFLKFAVCDSGVPSDRLWDPNVMKYHLNNVHRSKCDLSCLFQHLLGITRPNACAKSTLGLFALIQVGFGAVNTIMSIR